MCGAFYKNESLFFSIEFLVSVTELHHGNLASKKITRLRWGLSHFLGKYPFLTTKKVSRFCRPLPLPSDVTYCHFGYPPSPNPHPTQAETSFVNGPVLSTTPVPLYRAAFSDKLILVFQFFFYFLRKKKDTSKCCTCVLSKFGAMGTFQL